jgi:hypothetical protein
LLIPHRGRRWRLAPDFLGTAPKHRGDRVDDPDRQPQGVTGDDIEGEGKTQEETQDRAPQLGGVHLPRRGAVK